MLRFFKRREEKFNKLIEEQAALTLEGLMLLVKYLETQDPELAEKLSLKEKEADEVRRPRAKIYKLLPASRARGQVNAGNGFANFAL